MPSQHPFLVNLRGTAEYRRYLGRLEAKLQSQGIEVDGPNALAEYALAVLGKRNGLKAPDRMPPHGGRRQAATKTDI